MILTELNSAKITNTKKMNILMMTNTFTPHVGGVARSVQAFTNGYRKRGHRVLVVAPEYENMPEKEMDVIRIPAIQHFNQSDFSVVLPIPGFLTSAVEKFRPDIVHAHHPFLIGGTALRVAHTLMLPLFFTHHTMYEQYTHYVPADSEPLKRFVMDLSTRYANLCDRVFAPSESVASILNSRGVETPIDIVPTGVDCEKFGRGSGPGFRMAVDIPEDAFVVGHVGRLAPEKNLQFLAEGVADFLKTESRGHFLVVGQGPSEKMIRNLFSDKGIAHRLHFTGSLDHPLLTSAYRAMDVFAFASKSETQGMVLTEAMAAGLPVVALDAPGAREVVTDQYNGRLLYSGSVDQFASALRWTASLSPEQMYRLRQGAKKTAQVFSMDRSVEKALGCYQTMLKKMPAHRHDEFNKWTTAMRLVKTDWDIIKELTGAAGAAFGAEDAKKEE
jgi:glycosyltransferase involved in cell wall biosynthesis